MVQKDTSFYSLGYTSIYLGKKYIYIKENIQVPFDSFKNKWKRIQNKEKV